MIAWTAENWVGIAACVGFLVGGVVWAGWKIAHVPHRIDQQPHDPAFDIAKVTVVPYCCEQCEQTVAEVLIIVDGAGHHVVPIELAEANALVKSWHRHHQPSQGHRFSLGVVDADGNLHGAAIVGRPVARLAGSPRDVLEVVRLVTDGTENCCSILYAAAARAGHAMGYRRIQTYVLDSERGTSLKAAGWTDEGVAGGGQWKHTDGKPRRTDQPTEAKQRWAKNLAQRPDIAGFPDRATKRGNQEPDLFGGAA